MKTDLIEILLKLNGTLPDLPTKYCKKCGKPLINTKENSKVEDGKQYSEETGELLIGITKYLSCPKCHIKKKYILLNQCNYYWNTFSELKGATRLTWEEK